MYSFSFSKQIKALTNQEGLRLVNVNITDKYSGEIIFLNSIKIYYSTKEDSLLHSNYIQLAGDFFFFFLNSSIVL